MNPPQLTPQGAELAGRGRTPAHLLGGVGGGSVRGKPPFVFPNALNLEQVRLCRQGAAGILPAVLFSDLSAGKMPAAPWDSWRGYSGRRIVHPKASSVGTILLAVVLCISRKAACDGFRG